MIVHSIVVILTNKLTIRHTHTTGGWEGRDVTFSYVQLEIHIYDEMVVQKLLMLICILYSVRRISLRSPQTQDQTETETLLCLAS